MLRRPAVANPTSIDTQDQDYEIVPSGQAFKYWVLKTYILNLDKSRNLNKFKHILISKHSITKPPYFRLETTA